MKAYKVKTGCVCDEYTNRAICEKAEYFFDKEKALARYKEGEYTRKRTKITTIYQDGTSDFWMTGASYYEEHKDKKESNKIVELVDEIDNLFSLIEIEIN